MEDRSRLGRGLQEISRFYLSDSPRTDEGGNEAARSRQGCRRVVRVIRPGSDLLGAFFTANFSLELARHRNRVIIRDDFRDGEGVETVLRRILYRDPSTGALWVRLYGLHDIPVYRAGSHGWERLVEQMETAHDAPDDPWVVIHTPPSLDALAQSPVDFDAILLSDMDEPSLLQCYAFAKLVRRRDPFAGVSLVLAGPASDMQAGDLSSRFCAFAEERLGVCVDYLGHLVRDTAVESSISEHEPLVLGYDPSPARDSLKQVSLAFLERYQALGPRDRCRQ